MFETNVLGTMAVTQAVLPHMRAAGCGRIVTVSSVGGRVCGFGVTVYCASKFAQEGLGEGLALELAPFGIQSVIVEPGIDQDHALVAAPRDRARAPATRRARTTTCSGPARRWPTRSSSARRRGRRTSPRRSTRALTAEQPRMRYVVGRGASIVISLRRHLPAAPVRAPVLRRAAPAAGAPRGAPADRRRPSEALR